MGGSLRIGSPISRVPIAFVVAIAALWCWGVQRNDDEMFPYRAGAYGVVRQAAVIATAPTAIAAYGIVRGWRGGDDFLAFTAAHLLWSALAYLEWRLLVRAPRWLAAHRGARTIVALVALLVALGSIVGIAGQWSSAAASEHGLWWHIAAYVWALGFACVLGVLVFLARRHSAPSSRSSSHVATTGA